MTRLDRDSCLHEEIETQLLPVMRHEIGYLLAAYGKNTFYPICTQLFDCKVRYILYSFYDQRKYVHTCTFSTHSDVSISHIHLMEPTLLYVYYFSHVQVLATLVHDKIFHLGRACGHEQYHICTTSCSCTYKRFTYHLAGKLFIALCLDSYLTQSVWTPQLCIYPIWVSSCPQSSCYP